MAKKKDPPKPKPCVCEEGAPAWFITYCDMVTLLLGFFVAMFTMAAVKVEVTSAEMGFGLFRSQLSVMEDIERNPRVAPLSAMEESIQRLVQTGLLGDYLRVQNIGGNTVVSLSGKLLFEANRADVRYEAQELLSLVADMLANSNNKIQIVAHCSQEPVSSMLFGDYRQLCWYRAYNVMKELKKNKRVGDYRFRLTAAGPFSPAASNLFPESRARNDRVEIILLSETASEKLENEP